MKNLKLAVLAVLLNLCANQSNAQTTTSGANYISTGVSFLTISPDARASSMGEVGVSTSPDVNSVYWNPAKLANIEKTSGVSVNYSPWLRNLISDMSFSSIYGFTQIDNVQSVGAGLRYFNMGQVTLLRDQNETPITQSPYEFSLDLSYARKLTQHLSGGVGLRYIHSNLTSNDYSGSESSPGSSFAADVAFYGRHDLSSTLKYSWGVNISNIGPKISYTENREDFLPTNLRLGNTLQSELNKFNKVAFTIEINKLMVPTPKQGDLDNDNTNIIIGSNSDKSFLPGMFSSFSDAPGGFSEEFKEITLSIGMEYAYLDQFFFRSGVFLESENKGNRKYGTLGMGVNFQLIELDFSYLIPFENNHPLQNTLRFSLFMDLSKRARKEMAKF
eukprot:TRINITY_DN2824_c0_g1_i1.p1 TRINITY_DN2824_c0_g1~~TRINITY_DN2824_c0_g1_i1.p1  ORF type:complete len:388 (+),score=35.68 TRINITY_DN2824_c0_g1_i1:511-1674(+)